MAKHQLDDKQRKEVNNLRFSWHEKVIADPAVHRSGIATALAGYIMHRFNPNLGYAEFSSASAALELRIKQRSIDRAKAALIKRGWLVLKEAYTPGRRSWAANRYTLGGGPEDLELQAHTSKIDDPL